MPSWIPTLSRPDEAFPPREGNRVSPWIDGIPFYSRLYEAFEAAQHSIWFVVSFFHRDFAFPQGPTFWEALEAAHNRGIDVRVLFWRNVDFFNTRNLFNGDANDRALLEQLGVAWRIRWDSSWDDPEHCHHHKFWILDAGKDTEVGFIGGMTWGTTTLDDPGHKKQRIGRHDVCVEVQGPCAIDLAATFLAHWNRPQEDPELPSPWPDPDETESFWIELAPQPPRPDGALAQLSRSWGGRWHPPCHTGDAIFRQYKEAFKHAKQSIYIENQHPGELRLLEELEEALSRGVEVAYIVPGHPMQAIYQERQAHRAAVDEGAPPTRYFQTFEQLSRLGQYDNFTLASLATWQPEHALGPYVEIYVHAKLCIVDGAWLTCGSANLVDLSMERYHSELNLSVWDPALASSMLLELLGEHTHLPMAPQASSAAWLQQFKALADENAARRRGGEPTQGHCFRLDPSTYPEARARLSPVAARPLP